VVLLGPSGRPRDELSIKITEVLAYQAPDGDHLESGLVEFQIDRTHELGASIPASDGLDDLRAEEAEKPAREQH
jgi:hypothetical protein